MVKLRTVPKEGVISGDKFYRAYVQRDGLTICVGKYMTRAKAEEAYARALRRDANGAPKTLEPKRAFILEGRSVTLSEAAGALDVGLRTIIRHTHADVIDAAAIRALVPGEPLKRTISTVAAPKPIAKRTPAPRRTYAFADSILTLREWAEVVDVPEATLRDRIEMHGWTIERALNTPSQPKGNTVANRNRRIIARIASTFERAAA